MSRSTKSISPKGIIGTALVAAVVAAIIVAAGVKSGSSPKSTTVGTGQIAASATPGVPAGFTSVAISSGALTTDESVNGSLVLDKVTLVLHRIEGQTTSLSASAAAGRAPSAPTSNRSGSGTNGGSNTGGGTAQGNLAVQAFPTTTVACGSGGGGGPTTTTPGGPPTTTPSGPTTTSTPPTTLAPSIVTAAPNAGPSTTIASGCTPSGPSTTVARSGGTSGGTRTSNTGSGVSAGSSSNASSGARTTQVITSVLKVGDTAQLGTVLYTVESQPVVAMSGALPAWRTLTTGITDGPDVEQLEKSLVALGYDRDGNMTVDQHFDTNTAAAVKRWQTGYGMSATGKVTLGQVVFLPTSTTVSAVSVKVGDSVGDGDGVLSVAAASQQVVINVPTGDEAFVVPGLKVTLGGSGSSNTGTVSLVTSATQSGSTVVEAIITPDAELVNVQNGATVKVRLTHDFLSGVLMVPTVALASHIDGRYGVQVIDTNGTVSWHDVTVLGTANGMVAIKGTDGDTAIAVDAKVLQPL